MARGEKIDEFTLKLVRVLVFIDEDELKPALVVVADVAVRLQQAKPEREKIIKVHDIGGAFAGGEALGDVLDLRCELGEVLVFLRDGFRDRATGVQRLRENICEHVGFWKARGFHVDLSPGDAGLDEVIGVLAVHDREILAVTKEIRMTPQQPRSDGVKGAAPKRLQFVAEQVRDTAHHFARGFVGKGEEEYAIRRDPVFEQIRDSIGEGAGLARSGTGNDKRRSWRSGDGGMLLLVQFLGIVDLKIDRRMKRLQHVVARHGERLVSECKPRKENGGEEWGLISGKVKGLQG